MSYLVKEPSSTKVWHSTSGNNINRYLKDHGIDRTTDFTLESESAESSLAYISGKYNDSGLIHYYVIDTINIAGAVAKNSDVKICAWLDTSNGVKLKFKKANVTPAVTFSGYYGKYINGTWVKQEFSNETEVGFPSTQEGEIIVNFNNPFIPVFDNETKANDFIGGNDGTEAINYYNPAAQGQPISDQSNYFQEIKDYINKLLKDNLGNPAIKSRQDFVENILKPMNSMIVSYRRNNFHTKIANLKDNIAEYSKEYMDYANLEIIEKPSSLRGQTAFPSYAPYTPYYSYSPFTDSDINAIDAVVRNHYLDVSADKPYFLSIENISGSSSDPAYTIRVVQSNNNINGATLSNEKLANLKIISSSEIKDDKFYFENNNIEMKLSNYSGDFNHATFTYTKSNQTCSNWTAGSGQEINLYHGDTLLIDNVNMFVPFYCSHNVNITYMVENGEEIIPTSYTWLRRDQTQQDPYRNESSSAVFTPAGMILVKPVACFYNVYERSFINQWDGNKLKIADGYLIAPQVGAGRKDQGQFTGIFMGVSQAKSEQTKDYKVGLFGLHRGIQSLFINAEDGSAILGKTGAGQIIIDPQTNKGMLYSNNYWREYKDDGKPKNYNQSNLNHEGMLIDLTTPEIRFGNGNFVVDKEGNATIAGGGDISGWEIGPTEIHSRTSALQGRMVLDSGVRVIPGKTDEKGGKLYEVERYGRIYTGQHSTFTDTHQGFYLSDEGMSIGSSIRISSAGDGKIQVGRLSTDGKYWTIDGSTTNAYIGYNAASFACEHLDSPTAYVIGGNTNSVYLGTDGIRLDKRFAVDNEGHMVATSAIIDGTINVLGNGQSRIGNWTVNQDNLRSEIERLDEPAGHYSITIGSDGNLFGFRYDPSLGPPSPGWPDGEFTWCIYRDGKCNFKNLEATVPAGRTLTVGGSLTVGGTATFSGSASVSGTLTIGSNISLDGETGAGHSSKIGGFTINSNSLNGENDNIILSNSGDGIVTVGSGKIQLSGTNGGISCKTLTVSETTGGGGSISCKTLTVSESSGSGGSVSCKSITLDNSSLNKSSNKVITDVDFDYTAGQITGVHLVYSNTDKYITYS